MRSPSHSFVVVPYQVEELKQRQVRYVKQK